MGRRRLQKTCPLCQRLIPYGPSGAFYVHKCVGGVLRTGTPETLRRKLAEERAC